MLYLWLCLRKPRLTANRFGPRGRTTIPESGPFSGASNVTEAAMGSRWGSFFFSTQFFSQFSELVSQHNFFHSFQN